MRTGCLTHHRLPIAMARAEVRGIPCMAVEAVVGMKVSSVLALKAVLGNGLLDIRGWLLVSVVAEDATGLA